MSKFVVTTFNTETNAYEGMRALRELHAEGELTLYGLAVITKDTNGKLSVREAPDDLTGTAVGSLVGALVGVLGGPAGVIVGMTTGMMLGSIGDLLNIGVGTDFVDKVSGQLAPGKTAVIAEVDEDWITPLDTRMEAIGGSVAREWRSDFEEAEIAKETAARKAEFAQLRAEMAQSRADAKAKLQTRINEVKAKLDELSGRAQTKLQKLDKDTNAKIDALNDQIAKANAATKARIKERLVELRADRDRRSAKLREAGTLIKEALAA
ncbi:DUF1269 domain-containing protein [Bradyrhizobium sp. AUGA SZCCT0283]|uniref:DUF1269 domain-containing protein n=1 Tax=Bradyrhizobium sp. AUGA SZCCT0283 TaxID=2807671 RepID=UPI001BAA6B66|nr:DUF1269 domain-containing protein [Bradyrhizobium sp. AUGA SZCCT0283]MBR1280029.1 DUF1269 domain-containing protein [Bradyrhizobium sp. AUGA SZCCT0283]